MENNQAFVAKLSNLRSIEGASRIQSADVTLQGIPVAQVVVSKECHEGDLVVYFDANMALEPEFVEKIDRLDPQYNTEGFKGIGAYLAKGNRVKAIKLRGVISNGLVISLDKFSQAVGQCTFKEGDAFLEVGGTKVCHKWLPSMKEEKSLKMKEHRNSKKKVDIIIPEQFRFYVDTAQLARNIQDLQLTDVISISRKIHGTSAIASQVLVKRVEMPLKDKIAKLFGVRVEDTEYQYVYASRTVVKCVGDEQKASQGFYGIDIWTAIGKNYFEGKLKTGETVYYEIYGYMPGKQTMVQKDFDYGCKPGETKIAVYRITMTAADGTVTSLDWAATKQRCKELNVPMVPEYYYGRVLDMYPELKTAGDDWRKVFIEALRKDFLEKDITENLCKKDVPDEGIVLRIEGSDIRVYKLKSERFYAYESSQREDDTVVDIEAEEATAGSNASDKQ